MTKKKLNNGGKKANGVNSDSYISVLPAAILLEIFLRFPVILIINCKLVCKAWYNLISDSSFTINYLRNPPFTQFLLPVDGPRMLHLLEVSNNGNCIHTPFKVKLPPDWLETVSSFYSIRSCNGLLCIRIRKPGVEIVICNPIMAEYIALPQHPSYDDRQFSYYKIGFIPSTSKFKVLRITYKCTRPNEVEECDILTVGVDDKWRSLVIPDSFSMRNGVSLNGALHFINRVNDKAPFFIRTFDFAEEKAGQILHPPDVVMDRNTKLELFNNQLSFVDYSVNSQFTIWRMKEYGNGGSWTKDVIQKRWFPSGMRNRRLRPVGGLQNGNILFQCKGHLFSCNVNVKRKRCSEIELFDAGSGLPHMKPYVPNFSSLNEVNMKGIVEA